MLVCTDEHIGISHLAPGHLPELIGVSIWYQPGEDLYFCHRFPEILVLNLLESHGHGVGAYQSHHALVFITVSFRDDEDDLNIAVGGQAAGETIAGCSQSPCYMRRELPSKHQDTHIICYYLDNFFQAG